MALWTLHAAYDPEAHVWHTLDCDVPGLITQGETLERLRDRAAAVMPELLADNAALIPEERRRGPHQLRPGRLSREHRAGRRLMGGAYGRELKRILLDHDRRFVRHGEGDHGIWFSPITGLTFTVDVRTRKRFTAGAILKQAGMKAKV